MFTTKPESGEKITKLGGGDAKTPFSPITLCPMATMPTKATPSFAMR